MYYDNNVGGSVSLFDAFEAAGGGAVTAREVGKGAQEQTPLHPSSETI